ncbi:uncharacterized protein LOC110977079 isoform X2 [Acanthaster planci]|uniref:Uncharacterized protein LOC110977079 isoform X2 n=1 Tax=Acanthaster planci TaxID=133434 RepID=A0A8B7Y3X7_ACAPL|nr:uncharacterized protein LOC110977079 isoform X2 [Acanthaster planci]
MDGRTAVWNLSSRRQRIANIYLVWLIAAVCCFCQDLVEAGQGCSDGVTEGFEDKHRLAACSGSWEGHVGNATSLCAAGWDVCSWVDESILNTVTWPEAVSLSGCYAFNAGQDRGQCGPCADSIEQDDMGGVGRGCPHQNPGQTSCLGKGRIDASCCMDALDGGGAACSYRPGITTGVLCCKKSERAPVIHTHLPPEVSINEGDVFTLHCHTSGSPAPSIKWLRDGSPVDLTDRRVHLAPTGTLYITNVNPMDAGQYSCIRVNSAGTAREDAFLQVIRKAPLACSDGSTEGLAHFQDVAACAGSWKGHVRKGKILCAPGWHVCDARDAPLLARVSWKDANSVSGCYAMNIANNFGTCASCTGDKYSNNMAGMGRHCSKRRRRQPSCLGEGRIDVFYGKRKQGGPNCAYQSGLVSGVVCCQLVSENRDKGEPYCREKCENGGTCIGGGRCQCARGYKGALCKIPVCEPACDVGSVCIRPGVCSCLKFTDDGLCGSASRLMGKTKTRFRGICRRICMHGGKCEYGGCFCPATTRGRYCQHVLPPYNDFKELLFDTVR